MVFAPAEPDEAEFEPLAGDDDWPEPAVEVDNRGLEPPEPLVRTLEAVEPLAPGRTLAALLPREACSCSRNCAAGGHHWRGQPEADGSYRIVIGVGQDSGETHGR